MARPEFYPYSEEELQDKIDRYFQALDDDPTKRGGPADLLIAMDMDMETATKLCKGDSKTYFRYAKIMQYAANRLRAHLETSPAWGGPSGVKSMFVLKQQLWDGLAYSDKADSRGAVDATVRVVFGAGVSDQKAFD